MRDLLVPAILLGIVGIARGAMWLAIKVQERRYWR